MNFPKIRVISKIFRKVGLLIKAFKSSRAGFLINWIDWIFFAIKKVNELRVNFVKITSKKYQNLLERVAETKFGFILFGIGHLQSFINGIYISRLRFIVQFGFFLVIIYGAIYGIRLGSGLPTFACRYNTYPGGVCFFYSIQTYMSMPLDMIWNRMINAITKFAVWAILFNKSWCGWVCPMGFIQDLLNSLRNILGISPIKYSEKTAENIQVVKYIVLILMLMIPILISNSISLLPTLSREMALPFCQICPAKAIAPMLTGDFTSLNLVDNGGIIVNFLTTTKMVFSTLAVIILALFLVGSFFKHRFFCHFCPMAALLSLFDWIGFVKLKKRGERCTRCNNCTRVCPTNITAISQNRTKCNMTTQDCIMCLKCVEECPENRALRVTFFGVPLYSSSAKGFLKRQAKKNRIKNIP